MDADPLAEWGRLPCAGTSQPIGSAQSTGVKGAARREGYVQGALEIRSGWGFASPNTSFKGVARTEVGEAHGTCETANPGGGTGPHFWNAHEGVEGRGLAMSLATPESVGKLQSGLGTKAKNEPAFRFYQLYDKLYRADILAFAYALSKSNKGAPGVDGVSFAMVESEGLEKWLASLQQELRSRSYQPKAVRRVVIPKPGGGERPLGIPTIKDRVVQTAAVLVLEPIFEADLLPNVYGYREARSAHGAIEAVKQGLRSGMTEVVDADLTRYFDSIPHDQLMKSVARRIVDHHLLALIKSWLEVPIEEKDDQGRTRMSGGKDAKQGVPQGGPLSPLLANIYINRLVKAFAKRAREFQAILVNYADDFVILSCGKAREALAWVRRALERMGLRLNEAKTSIRNACSETFDFLGFTLGRQKSQRTGYWCFPSKPSKRSIERFKEGICEVLGHGNMAPIEEVVRSLNRKIRGWAAYFQLGAHGVAFKGLNRFVANRARQFLRRRHKVPSRGTKRFGRREIYSDFGVVSIEVLGRAVRS